MKGKHIQEAYAKCQPGRDFVNNLQGRCMEVLEDKAGIVCERYCLANGRSVVVFATPHWWDIFVPVSPSAQIENTLLAVKAFSEHAPAIVDAWRAAYPAFVASLEAAGETVTPQHLAGFEAGFKAAQGVTS